MKRAKKLLAFLLAVCFLMSLTAACSANDTPKSSDPESPTSAEGEVYLPKDTHLLRNSNGSYGGSLNEEKYGPGAPMNGRYDVEDSAYYTVNNDYYNMTSTNNRLIFPGFASYQQTMQDSSGIACLLMVLNYMGKDVAKEYTELALVKKYEEVNQTQVYGNGTTEEGLIKLVNSLDLGIETSHRLAQYLGGFTKESTKNFLRDSLQAGKFVLVRYQSPVGYGWKVVIGYDTQGNVTNTNTLQESDAFGEDVVIFAEPYDGFDHYQDGYATERVQDFYAWWREMQIDGTVSGLYSYVILDPKLDIQFDLQPVDETAKQTAVELHLPLNPNGGYGGTRDASLYGTISSGNGWWNHPESNYYKINDFYNMGSEGSRLLLKNYTVLQQTMGSSCGICAVNSVFAYYGETTSQYDLEASYLEQYEQLNAAVVKGRGTSIAAHSKTVAQLGYKTETNSTPTGTKPPHTTYEAYMAFLRSHLTEDRPVVVSTNLGSGHYLTVIGLDDMGTEYIYDDVIICADSSDYWDGYQDGYDVYSAYKFFRQHTNSSYKRLQNYIVIYRK